MYTKAIELDPTKPSYYTNRSAVNINLHKFEDALKDAEKAIEVDENYSKGYIRKADILLRLNKKEEALKFCEESLLKFPENVQLLSKKKKAETPDAPAFNI